MKNDIPRDILPTLVIGLGGTGFQIVKRLKNLFAKKYNGESLPIRYLVIDTDLKSFLDDDIDRYEYNYSNDFIYNKDNTTISFNDIEKNLRCLSIEDRIKYLNDISSNMSKNRFYIEWLCEIMGIIYQKLIFLLFYDTIVPASKGEVVWNLLIKSILMLF